jgi:non-homologous end joining protein Ku
LPTAGIEPASVRDAGGWSAVRKLIAFDDDTFDKLKQLGRDRMATIQELADEAFADMLKKHGIPIDLKDALRKSASLSKAPAKKAARSIPSRSSRSRKPKS